MTLINHQHKQQEIINKIADQVNNNSLNFSTVSPVTNYEIDPRICLTSVHLPHQKLIDQVQAIIEPLRKIEPSFFYYPNDSLHLTVKNVRVINDPPHFNEHDAQKAKEVFSRIIPKHKQFQIYFYRLLLFPNNLALIGTTDPELDSIILDLDDELKNEGIPDDKVYVNSKYFFSNMTLVRFNTQLSQKCKEKIFELSNNLKFEPYLIDSVTLLSCNAVFKKRHEIGTWQLQKTIR